MNKSIVVAIAALSYLGFMRYKAFKKLTAPPIVSNEGVASGDSIRTARLAQRPNTNARPLMATPPYIGNDSTQSIPIITDELMLGQFNANAQMLPPIGGLVVFDNIANSVYSTENSDPMTFGSYDQAFAVQ